MKKIKIYCLAILTMFAGAITSCDIGPTDALLDIIQEDKGYIPVIANFTLSAPVPTATTPGTECRFDLRYWSEGEIDKIRFWVKVGDAAAVQVQESDYQPAFSNVTKTDSLLFNYTIPNDVAAGTVIGVEARVTNQNLPDYAVTRIVNVTVQ
ncbi:hypothetical protein [Pararhodonellum marinum]|uniref:hypothetical protein n=1 Tax=Pararhodonellum marinum TaxID=2755358 RepID=UPI0018907A84|nr:hypothetical protein [Pararhodonellum marinum]